MVLCASSTLPWSRKNGHLAPVSPVSVSSRGATSYTWPLKETVLHMLPILDLVSYRPCFCEGLGLHKTECWRLLKRWKTKTHSDYFILGGFIVGIRGCKMQPWSWAPQGSQENPGLVDMNMVEIRTSLFCWALILSSLIFNFFYHLHPPPSHCLLLPLLPHGLCCWPLPVCVLKLLSPNPLILQMSRTKSSVEISLLRTWILVSFCLLIHSQNLKDWLYHNKCVVWGKLVRCSAP